VVLMLGPGWMYRLWLLKRLLWLLLLRLRLCFGLSMSLCSQFTRCRRILELSDGIRWLWFGSRR
jgi:hypothetical protein